MKRLLTAASAAALSLALVAGAPAIAQDAQSADAALTGMAELGIATDGLMLTDEQVTQVQAVLGDAAASDTDKVARIETLLAE